MLSDAFWIIFTGVLVATTCGLLGSFLVLRKMAMVGDAISHSVLPGIVLAYLIAESRSSLPMLIGAAAFGLLTTLLIEFFHKRARLQEDASIGLIFTFLFAVGVIMVTYFAGDVDLDQDCVLYGELAFVPLNTLTIGALEIPRETLILSITFIVILAFILIGYRGLYLTTFDPGYAAAIGISTALWHYLLMGAVSLTTVVSFESVGAILVVAFLIAPAATAYLLTDRLPMMLLLSALVGVLSSIGGYYLAVVINGSVAGAMSTVSGGLFLLAFLYSILRRRFYVAEKKVSMS